MKKSDDKYYQIKFLGKQYIASKHFFDTDVSSCDKIFKIDLIKKCHIRFPKGLTYEDAAFFFKYFAVAQSIYYVPDFLYNYLRRAGSIMNGSFKKTPKAIDHVKIMKDVHNFLRKKHLFKKQQTEFLLLYMVYLKWALNHLPNHLQYRVWEIAWPMMKKFSAKDISSLRFWQQEQWRQLLRKCYNYNLNQKSKLRKYFLQNFVKG